MDFPWLGRITAWSAPIRATPHMNKSRPMEGILESLSRGTPVTVTGQNKGWLYVKAQGKKQLRIGYVSKELVERVPEQASAKQEPKGTQFGTKQANLGTSNSFNPPKGLVINNNTSSKDNAFLS